MPRPLQTSTDDLDESVSYQLLVPRWMKNGAIVLAKEQGKTLTDWTRDLLRAALDAGGQHRPRRRQG
jgi:hypothetical protein